MWDHENRYNQKLICVYDRRLILSTVLPSRKLRVSLIFNIKELTSKPHLLKNEYADLNFTIFDMHLFS